MLQGLGIRGVPSSVPYRLLPMHTLIDPYWWTFALASLVQLVIFVRWFYRRIRNDEVNSIFIRDMATNHLPQIYELLEKLCVQQGIVHDPQSPIRWVDMGNRGH